MSVAARAIIWAQTGVLQPANNSRGHVNPHGENVTVNKKSLQSYAFCTIKGDFSSMEISGFRYLEEVQLCDF